MSDQRRPTDTTDTRSARTASASDPALIDQAVEVARQAAERASAITRDTPVGRISTKKHPADMVTEVDTAVERAVREVIRGAFAEHSIVGEEYGGVPADGPTWYCDPVDGTTNLVSGMPWTSFSLCLAVGRRPLVGAVADPWRGRVWLAAEGRGVQATEQRAASGPGDPAPAGAAATSGQDSASASPAESRTGATIRLAGTVVGTELSGYQPWTGMAQFLNVLAERHCTGRIMGSSTLTLAQPGIGQTAGAVLHRFQPEDHLAAALIGQEAGLAVWDADRRQQPFPDGGIMIARPEVAEELHGLWTQAAAERSGANR